MALSPEDVRNKRFTPVRLREGYDMGEVDQFLDQVESELERLRGELGDLRGGPGDSPDGGPGGSGLGPVPQLDDQPVAPTTVREASGAAARLLEIATRNADEVVTDAKDQAGTIIGAARTEADRIDDESRTRADQMESQAGVRAEELDAEIAARRERLLADLQRERDALSADIAQLQVHEREYRARLRNFFEAQLAQLADGQPAPSPPTGSDDTDPPTRLRSLLDEEGELS